MHWNVKNTQVLYWSYISQDFSLSGGLLKLPRNISPFYPRPSPSLQDKTWGGVLRRRRNLAHLSSSHSLRSPMTTGAGLGPYINPRQIRSRGAPLEGGSSSSRAGSSSPPSPAGQLRLQGVSQRLIKSGASFLQRPWQGQRSSILGLNGGGSVGSQIQTNRDSATWSAWGCEVLLLLVLLTL